MDEKRRLAEREQRLKARKRDNRWKSVIVCLVLGGAIIIGLLVLFDLKGASIRDESGKLSLNVEQGFPYSIENTSSSKNLLKATKDQLVLLNGTLLEFINPANGKAIKSEVHFFSNPVFDVNGKYVLTFDQGRTKLRVDTAANTIFENELEQNIITAAIGRDGTFAVATVPERGDSQLAVYSKSLNELFTWNSMDGYIIEIDLSTDGNFAAVAAVTSVDGSLKTKVHVFHIKKQKEISVFEFAGASAPVIHYVSGNDFFVMTADCLSYISNNKEKTDLLTAGGQTLLDYSFNDTGVLSLLYTKYDSVSSTVLACYSKNGKIVYSNELTESVKRIYSSRSAVAVLFSDRVEIYNQKGALAGQAEISPYANNVVQFGSKLYILGVDELERVTVTPVSAQ